MSLISNRSLSRVAPVLVCVALIQHAAGVPSRLPVWQGASSGPRSGLTAHAQGQTVASFLKEVGFCAHFKAPYGLDLDSVRPLFTGGGSLVPDADPPAVIGYAAGTSWRQYADNSGWAMVCGAGHPKRDVAAKAFIDTSESSGDLPELHRRLKAITTAGANLSNIRPRYYDFNFPRYRRLPTVRFNSQISPVVTIPANSAISEASFVVVGYRSIYNVCGWGDLWITLDGRALDGSPNAFCYRYGQVDVGEIADGREHTFACGGRECIVFLETDSTFEARGSFGEPYIPLTCPLGLVDCGGSKLFVPHAVSKAR